MATLEAFLEAIAEQPEDDAQWLILADWLDEHDDPRGEQVRLLHALRQPQSCVTDRRSKAYRQRQHQEERLLQLQAHAVPTCQPTRVNSAGVVLALIPPGTFLMGSPRSELERQSSERWHRVTMGRAFWIGTHLVTQQQWRAVMGTNPSRFEGDTRPVERVSWDDCQDFCRRLSRREGRTYRLPTEAEWEYACRAGTTTPYYFGPTVSPRQANYNGGGSGAYRAQTTATGTFPPNRWGLTDMHGNLWEWCQDWFGKYPRGAATDPRGPETGEVRVLRGGSWGSYPSWCRSASRCSFANTLDHRYAGFRVVLPVNAEVTKP
jgi:uncharacterized protein (TIGR02996 family)